MVFPVNNLPTASLPWAREVEKQLSTATSTIASNELNNAARDNQLSSSLTRLNKTVTDVAAATQTAQSAATDAATAAQDAQDAADAAAAAATTANNAIAILSSLTSTTVYPGVGSSWNNNASPPLPVDYYGSTYIDIPESGGSRLVTVTATFDVDLATAAGANSTQTRQTATAYLSSGVNSTYSGVNRGTNGAISVYGGGSLTVSGQYTVTSSSTLSWNPWLTVSGSGTSGTFNGSAILRFVTVTITKV